MRRLLVGLTALLLLAACGQPPAVDPTPTPTPTATPVPTAEPTAEPTPTQTAEPTESPDPDPTEDATTTAYFVRSVDAGFFVEPATGPHVGPPEAVARAAFEFMVSGEPADPGLASMTGPGVEVLGVHIEGDLLTVDLSGALRDNRSGGSGEVALAEQLAHTGTQFDGVERVQLHVDGAVVSELWGHLDWSEPVTPDEFALSPITFDTPPWGASVAAGAVTFGGEANTFEATLELHLIAPDGKVVEKTFTTATLGSGTRGTWEHTLDLGAPGTWTVEAIEPDPSGGEGRPPFTTSIEVQVS